MTDERNGTDLEADDWTEARPGRPPVLAVEAMTADSVAADPTGRTRPGSPEAVGPGVEGAEGSLEHHQNGYQDGGYGSDGYGPDGYGPDGYGPDGYEQIGYEEADVDLTGHPVVPGRNGQEYARPQESVSAAAGSVAPGPEQLHWGRAESAPVAAPRPPSSPAQWGWRSHLRRGSAGLLRFGPGTAERTYREAIETIRRSTWRRSVNVVVTNPKGGTGKTPATLILAGILGSLRGGYVVACEATESCGTLARRAEGAPAQGLAELLADLAGIDSAGRLGSYTAPQTSHADVIGSLGRRGTLSAPQLLSVREVLDTYYRISVLDTGNNPGHETYRCAVRMADAILIPCLVSQDSMDGVEQTLELLASGSAPDGLRSRVVVVLGHDGGPEDPQVVGALHRRLAVLGLADLVEVPFDPVIRRGGEIVLSDLGEESRRSWTLAAAAVVRSLSLANTQVGLVAQMRGEIG